MQQTNTRRGFTQINKVILNLTADLQRLPLLLINNLRGRFRIKYGMTASYNNSAFTLIELLVAVLIIGILSAVAVPQYQFAIDKLKFNKMLTVVRAVRDQQILYYLAHGNYAANCKELNMDLPSETYLDNRKRIANKKGDFYVECYWAANKDVGGFGTWFLGTTEVELGFGASGSVGCYSNVARGKRLCKNLCGPLQQGMWCNTHHNY